MCVNYTQDNIMNITTESTPVLAPDIRPLLYTRNGEKCTHFSVTSL